jgi:transposase
MTPVQHLDAPAPPVSTVELFAGFPVRTVGLDLGDCKTHYCILDAEGNVVRKGTFPTTQDALTRFFQDLGSSRVAFEASPHASWMHDISVELGHEVIVGNPREVKAISGSAKKTDGNDAEMIARLARADVQLLRPIRIRGVQARRGRTLLRARDGLVRSRTSLINSVRGLSKSEGVRIVGGTSRTFHHFAAEQLSAPLRETLWEVLQLIERLTQTIHAYDDKIEALANTVYPVEMERLQQIKGVGPITALAFLLAIEDPSRFRRSRQVAPYLGLVPSSKQSGNQDPECRIHKRGDSHVRWLLVQAAQYTLHRGPDTDLRRFGQKLAAKGGKSAKKRAIVAVARKLSVLLHRLWVSGSTYEALRESNVHLQTSASG